MNTSNRLSIWRIVGAVITAVCVCVAINTGWSAYTLHREITAAETAKPATFAADLSLRGINETAFVQTCTMAHGESILLETSPQVKDSTNLLKGLSGRLQVIRADGHAVLDMPIPSPRMGNLEEVADKIEIAYFSPFDKGKYVLRLEVTEPAPALAGHTQTLYARYWLCGLESLPIAIGAGISLITGLLSLIIGIPTAIGLKRHGWRREM